MRIKRHKYYRKEELKIKLTDEQYRKRIEYLSSILNGETLPPEALDHPLKGEYQGSREFHLAGDVLIIYTVKDETLYLQRIGTHNQLFKNS
jgi:mRNA interferase YafQ